MPSRNPWATYKLGSLVAFLYRYRICSSSHDLSLGYNHGLWISRPLGYGSSMHQGRRLFSASSVVYNEIDMLKEDNEKVQVQTSVPVPPHPNFSFSTWGKWFVGSILSLLLPFLKKKWDNLLKLEGKLEKAAEEVVYVAEVVEKVATTTEKVSAEVADKLPGDGKLKQTALMVEHISNTAAADAQLTEHFIDKVANLKQDFEELEKMVEPFIDRIAEENSHVNHLNNPSVIPSSTKGKGKIGCSIGKENWFNQPANSNVNHMNNLRIAPSSTKGKQKIGSSTGKENWFTQSAPASNFSSSKIKAQSARHERNRNDSSTCSRREMAQRARRERERSENYTQPLPKDFPVLTPPKSLSQFSKHAPPSLRTILAEHSPTQLCNVEVYIEGYMV